LEVFIGRGVAIGSCSWQLARSSWQFSTLSTIFNNLPLLHLPPFLLIFKKLTFAKKNSRMEKKASESLVVMTELVLPNDTNNFGNLMGGRLMYWMDIAAALAAMKHCAAPVVTASVDNISFETPIKIGNVVHIEAKVTRAFNSSMEVHMNVWGEDAIQQYRYKSNEAYYTFVALDPNGKPRPINTLVPETEDEIKLHEGALRRRQIRLILGGKMKPEDAEELKALFVK
jgi:acyl-CoA hydrolase